MTLDASKPEDSVQQSEIPSYIRENRIEINSGGGGSGSIGSTVLEVPGGTTSLTVGAEVGDYNIETVIISGSGASSLQTILGGTEGQIKILVFQDANIDLVDGSKTLGEFYLNQLPIGGNFEPKLDDLIVLLNIGGDGDLFYGYWKELYRMISVK